MGQDAKNWFKQAEKDFDTAKFNLDGEKIEAGVFFLQQSAEKALKAVYIKKFNNLLKVHDLVLLARKVNAPKNILEFCKELGPAYQYTRYPDIPQIKDLYKITDKFIEYARDILKWAKKNI